MKPPILPQPAYRVDLLESCNLATIEDIKGAMDDLGECLTKENYQRALEGLLNRPLTVALILSGIPDSVPLNTWILDDFPQSPSAYNASIASKLTNHLSQFYAFQDLPIIRGDAIASLHRQVVATPQLLSILSTMHFVGNQGESQEGHGFEDDEELPHFFKIKTKGQKKRPKRGVKPPTPLSNNDYKLLNDSGISTPCSREESDKAILVVLAKAKGILQHYLDMLRAPKIAAWVQETFLPTNAPAPATEIQPQSQEKVVSEIIEEKVPAAYPMVQPMKSALHFNSAEGFGEWRILISTRADGDLREARRKDRKTFTIIVKKIKELSNGHFSDDNQKRLNGPTTDVPIFEAKMTRDSRLVYQVDSISEYDSTVERQGASFSCVFVLVELLIHFQVLRIFGIYTHAQMDSRLWESIGRQLGSKGKEYRRRCNHRERPIHSGDNVFLPASFPPLEVEATATSTGIDLPPDDLAQEKEIIEHPYSCYVLGRSGTGKTTTMLFKMLWIERTFQMNSNDLPKPRQIFVTKSRVLAGKVEEYFLKLLESLKTASKSREDLRKLTLARKAENEDDNLVDLDDEDNWRSDLPRRFSELQDSHFPLFLTFDRLCDLIEADFDASYNYKEKQTSRSFVSYEVFEDHYWSHFPQPLIKGLEPTLVFSEIIGKLTNPAELQCYIDENVVLQGIIKGSEGTIASECGYLERKVYEELSERAQSTFATQRGIIYSIFEAYQARKRQRGDYDAADRTHCILRIFQTPGRGVMGQKIDQLCVDEAQDNLLIDALHGLFWAGDTAQTISVGSAFRFDDLKAFLFRVEKRRVEKQQRHSTIEGSQIAPKTFQLATNYRSHAGIVNCAQSVIELITRFWPYSIDTLAPEKGIVEGLKPVFLNGWDEDNVRYEQFLFGSSGSHIEFGAQQCILVRDDSARRKLQEQVGDIGLIMTLYESKGLEFNDDSSAESSQWRLLLTAAKLSNESTTMAAPQFDRVRHASVCAELKFLYVAITRARKNLWIADQSQKGEPMRIFWTKRDQIHNCTPGTDMPRLAVTSSREEWASKGKELFERKKFLQAKHCYERASMTREMAIANAYYLRSEARKAPMGESRRVKEPRNQGFVTAANAFVACAQEAGKNRTVYFKRAAECYELGAEELRAAKTYLLGHEYDVAAKLFRKLGLFDEAVDVIKQNEEHMQSDIVENIKEVARLYYFREAKLEKARELFTTDEEELEYLEDLDLDIARAEVLVSLGRSAEAAALHMFEGRVQEAIPLFLQNSQSVDSMHQACLCILRGFWDNISFGVTHDEDQISQLITWSDRLNVDLLNSNSYHEISMFRAIIARDRPSLAKLAHIFLGSSNTSAATLCLHHLFRTFPRIAVTTSSQELADILELFLAYIRLLYELAFQLDPRATPYIHTLFGFRHISLDDFFVPPNTFLFDTFNVVGQQATSEGIPVTGQELCQVLTRVLSGHLWQRITEQINQCRNTAQISPCLTFVIFEYCNRVHCPQEHMSPSALSADWYNTRVRINLQQMLILQTLYSMGGVTPDEMKKQKRQYICQLYEAVNPPFYRLGTHSQLNPDLIPEYRKGIQVLKEWLRDAAYVLDFNPRVLLLTNLLRISSLALMFDRRDALNYLRKAPCLSSAVRPYLRGSSGGFVLVADLLETIYSGVGADFLLFESSDLASVPSVRGVFMARICRAVCLLGYNISGYPLRTSILRALVSVKRADRKFPPLYKQFILARRWEDLVSALRGMLQGSLADELVQLHDLGRQPVPTRPMRGVRIVPFKAGDDLLQLLGVSPPLSMEPTGVETYGPQELESENVALNDGNVDVDNPVDLDEQEEVETIEETGDAAWPGDTEHGPAMTSADMQAQPPTEEEQQAAGKILKRYRHICLQRSQGAKEGSASRVANMFDACLKRSNEITWGESTGYRVLFLGPLPHILLCLDVALATTSTQKKNTKKRLIEDDHGNFESIGPRLTELVKVFKALLSLQKLLEPTSDIHTRLNIGDLRRRVREAAEILQTLPFPTTEQFRGDLGIAVKGVVTDRPLPKPISKPNLVCEEDI
ncbi:hypothetical protein DXG01_005721 [Tephrocybe rancida]|nr:hypothetical protein DXG01_005721 [Tephrocybe rancida]